MGEPVRNFKTGQILTGKSSGGQECIGQLSGQSQVRLSRSRSRVNRLSSPSIGWARGGELGYIFFARRGLAERKTFASLTRFLVLVICLISFVGVEPAIAQTVGTVTKVEKQAQVGSTPAAVGTPVNMNVELRTGVDARLQNIFIDNTTLTLGENARVVVDRYVFNPNTSTGAMVLNTSTAALRFSSGKIGQMRNKDVTVNTPYAALSVRGTEFWAGIVDYKYGVVLLSSTGTRVGVSNSAGAEMLNEQYEGTDFEPSLKGVSAPGKPYIWHPDKIQRALKQTDIGLAFNPGMLTPGLLLVPLIPALQDEDKGGNTQAIMAA